MNIERPLRVVFYRTETGNEPVRAWLRALSHEEKKIIGEDIKTIQFGWPLGMPLVRKLDTGLWEVRSALPNRIARIVFAVQNNLIILLHSFIKKSPKTPKHDLQLAKTRAAALGDISR